MHPVGRVAPVVAMLLAGLGLSAAPAAAPATPPQPNIVVILTDDLSANLTPYMSEVTDLAAHGVTFDAFITSNSQCCPSRTTAMTGQYPHNSGVRTNVWPLGGFGQFMAQGHLDSSVGTYLQAAGYRTGLLGKYLNAYEIDGDHDGGGAPDYPANFVPPGWNEWFTPKGADRYFGYQVLDSIDGRKSRSRYGTDPAAYRTDALADRASEFIDRAGDRPFFLMISTNATHATNRHRDLQQPDSYRFPPAPRDRSASPNRPPEWGDPEFPDGDCGDPVDGGCLDIIYPDPAWEDFNVIPSNPPRWAPHRSLTPEELENARSDFVERVQMVQSVNDLIRQVRAELAAQGVTDDTYVIFGSDNGYHLGEHALRSGKQTAYDHDVRLPFVISTPRATRGATQGLVTSNVDILPTLLDLGGAPLPSTVDGHSLRPFLQGGATAPPTSSAALIEHEVGPDDEASYREDPDWNRTLGKEPARYLAVRTDSYLYVDYSVLDGVRPRPRQAEFYWLSDDPYQVNNLWTTLTRRERDQLNSYLVAFAACAGTECQTLSRAAPGITP